MNAKLALLLILGVASVSPASAEPKDGSDIPLHARLLKVDSAKGRLNFADMSCARVTDDPEKLKCTFSMMFLAWNGPPDVYDQRDTEANRTKLIDEAIAEMQNTPQSFCKKIGEVVDEIKKPTGQRTAQFMDVETRGIFDKVLDVCETTDPGNLTARLISLMPRAIMDAITIRIETARIQRENESCYYSLSSRTQTFSKQSENKWEYKKRDAMKDGCDRQDHSEVVFDPERKEWTWSTELSLAPNVDPEKKCEVFRYHNRYKPVDEVPMPSCKYLSNNF